MGIGAVAEVYERLRRRQQIAAKCPPRGGGHQGRYLREEEVAARVVNKQRAERGETQEAKARERPGKSLIPSLPIAGYAQPTVDQASTQLDTLSREALKRVQSCEQQHRNRKTMLEALDRHLKALYSGRR
jgi:hypothetical protein